MSFELEGLGVDVLTYEPGPLLGENNLFLNSIFAKGTLIKPFCVDQMTAARVALAELNMSAYGSSCGTNIRHETFEYVVNHLMPYSWFNYFMLKNGVRIQTEMQGAREIGEQAGVFRRIYNKVFGAARQNQDENSD